MYKLNNSEDAEKFLKGLGLHLDEVVVRQVVNVLSGKAHQSIYSLWATRPDKPPPVCGKGSIYKIKKLYDEGELQPYLDYISDTLTIDEAKAEQTKEAKHDIPKESQTEQKPYEETPHKWKMRELAARLKDEITLPHIVDSFIDDLKPQRLLLGRGMFPISIANKGEIKVDLSIEGETEITHLYQALCSHLRTGGFSEVLDKIDTWRSAVVDNLQECHRLLRLVRERLEKTYNVSIPGEDRGQPGITKWFPITICADAVYQARGKPWIDDSWYRYETYGGGVALKSGAYGIYNGKPDEDLKPYQEAHIKLRGRYATSKLAKVVAEQRKKLDEAVADLRQQLQKFIDIERLRGHCELCS
jgi:hypothetical protein